MPFPPKRILCPIDFDAGWGSALELAEQVARTNDATVILLHVVPMNTRPSQIPRYIDIYKAQTAEALDLLKDIAMRRMGGVEYEILTPLVEPAEKIIQVAEEIRADIIVMATHGRRGVARFFIGSTAEMVLRDSPCPVLAVRYREAKDSSGAPNG